jgi:hypothetical protein
MALSPVRVGGYASGSNNIMHLCVVLHYSVCLVVGAGVDVFLLALMWEKRPYGGGSRNWRRQPVPNHVKRSKYSNPLPLYSFKTNN